MRKSSTSRSQRSHHQRLQRKHVVWGALLASMTMVGGVLLLLEDRPAAEAMPMAQVARASRSSGIEAVLQPVSSRESSPWKGIVIHHSATPFGSAHTISDQHIARGFKGLGYHFVIGNGQGAPDGQIVVGYRWQDQLPGVHTSGPQAETYNRETIGICLVGDGDRREFTTAQFERLMELVTTLQAGLGIPDHAVVLHRDVAPTSAPGRHFPEISLRQRLLSAQ